MGVVTGGGNFWRGRTGNEIDRVKADQIGMLREKLRATRTKQIHQRLVPSQNAQRVQAAEGDDFILGEILPVDEANDGAFGSGTFDGQGEVSTGNAGVLPWAQGLAGAVVG